MWYVTIWDLGSDKPIAASTVEVFDSGSNLFRRAKEQTHTKTLQPHFGFQNRTYFRNFQEQKIYENFHTQKKSIKTYHNWDCPTVTDLLAREIRWNNIYIILDL